jgi:hypothetical protein
VQSANAPNDYPEPLCNTTSHSVPLPLPLPFPLPLPLALRNTAFWREGTTALYVACANGNLECVVAGGDAYAAMLLQCCCNAAAAAAAAVCFSLLHRCARLLLQAGAIQSPTLKNSTPCHAAGEVRLPTALTKP